MGLTNWLKSVTEAGRDLLNKEYQRKKTLPPQDVIDLCSALHSVRGDAMGTALAAEIVTQYPLLSADEKTTFFLQLQGRFSPNSNLVLDTIQAYQEDGSSQNLRKLAQAIEAPLQHLLRRINMAGGGTRVIIEMRRDLLRCLKDNPALSDMDLDFAHLLSAWFNPGFLELRKIDWEAPANLLEKLIEYEAVHPMAGWEDLRRRLGDNRRCFGFFHPALPDEPLIFIEVALLNQIATSVETILDPLSDQQDAGESPTTAIFYSISNTQEGLRGISFGNFLIKKVVLELQDDLPSLKEFATLSPIPGFLKWLDKERGSEGSIHIPEGHREQIRSLEFKSLEVTQLDENLQAVLTNLCAHYLKDEKRGDLPLDPVARFHLSNGASIDGLNWAGDLSQRRIDESLGLLVNYRYRLSDLEKNHEDLFANGKIAISGSFTTRV